MPFPCAFLGGFPVDPRSLPFTGGLQEPVTPTQKCEKW